MFEKQVVTRVLKQKQVEGKRDRVQRATSAIAKPDSHVGTLDRSSVFELAVWVACDLFVRFGATLQSEHR